MIEAVEACVHGGIQDICGLFLDAGIDGCQRLMAGASWSKAVALGCKRGFPCGCEGACGDGWPCAVVQNGEAQRPWVCGGGLGNPDPADWLGLAGEGEGAGHAEPVGGRERLDPIDPSGPFPAVVLGHPSGSQKRRGPRGDEASLALTHGGTVPTTTGAVEALLAREDRPCDATPWDGVPCLHRREVRVHAVWTPLGPSPIQTPGRTSAYPRAFPEAVAF
jgi:hypothetical protein